MTGGKQRPRLFFALWPDAATRQAIAAVRDRIAAAGRPVADKRLHLTLAFLGERLAPEPAAAAGTAAADQGADGSFTLRLDRIGYFARPRVAWLGTEAPPEPLIALHDRLARALRRQGARPERRPFHAHVTLLRHARPPDARLEAPVEWPVRELTLVASELRPEGACYTVLERWPL